MEQIPQPEYKKLSDVDLGTVYRRPNDPKKRFSPGEYWIKVGTTRHQPVERKSDSNRLNITVDEPHTDVSPSYFDPNEIVEIVEK